ncbi:MAG: lipopolysaccharide biosynthesis protein [Clostridia bacterium]|nr:lipopolysaccharide biosynthesis protein [Clostridia bacterium]
MKTTSIKQNMLWNAVGNVVYLICQWLITVLVTVFGGFEDAGLLSIAMSVSGTFQTVAMFGIRNYQVSDLEGKYSDSCYMGFRMICCVAAMVFCVGFSLISRYLGAQLLAICLFMLFRLAESYSDALHGIAQKNGRLDIAGKSFAMKGIGLLACFLAGYLLSKSLNIGLFCMMLFSLSVTVLYDLPMVKRVARFRLFEPAKDCMGLGLETWPLCVYLFLSAALSTVPKLILEKQCGEVLLGAYSSIFAPAMLLQAATGYLYNPFATQFTEHLQSGSKRNFKTLLAKLCGAILVIAVLALVAAQFLGEFALVLVFGEQIRAYVNLLNPILIVNFCISFLGLFCMLAVVLRKFWRLLSACGAALLVCVLLTSPLLKRFGANGASYSLIAACLLGILILAIGVLIDISRMQTEASAENE